MRTKIYIVISLIFMLALVAGVAGYPALSAHQADSQGAGAMMAKVDPIKMCDPFDPEYGPGFCSKFEW